MKRMFIIAIAFAMIFSCAVPCNATVKGITAANYDTYVKPNPDPHFGYNKGESDPEYKQGEEFFYNEYYDHWNVDLVYDASLVPKTATGTAAKVKTNTAQMNLAIAKKWAKKHYPKRAIKVVAYGKVPKHRKSKKVVYIERIPTVSDGGHNGHDICGYYVYYSKKVAKGKKHVCYAVWNPNNNACDDVVAFVSCKCVK